jgi:hypothetical protein
MVSASKRVEKDFWREVEDFEVTKLDGVQGIAESSAESGYQEKDPCKLGGERQKCGSGGLPFVPAGNQGPWGTPFKRSLLRITFHRFVQSLESPFSATPKMPNLQLPGMRNARSCLNFLV